MPFHIREHIISCQHIRQCEDPERFDKAPKLSVKQYSPKDHPLPADGDITIIAAHGNGLVKELYEPLWEELQHRLREIGRGIRSIWIADTRNHGASGLLNEQSKFDDVSWYDHSRDLLHLVNHFRAEMVPPIVGVGHSMGGGQLAMLALGHPMLFSTLVLIDPIIAPSAIRAMSGMLARATLRRRVEWPSREAAENTFKMAFKSWDPRVLERFNRYALYPYPKEEADEVVGNPTKTRLITGRFQELSSIVRPAFIYTGNLKTDKIPYVEEVFLVNELIGFIPCNTVYICGDLSPSAGKAIRKDWLARTGTAAHMGKRTRKRRVEERVLPNVGHFGPMEAPQACAEAVAQWIDEDIRDWEVAEDRLKTSWRNLSSEVKGQLADLWMRNLKAKL